MRITKFEDLKCWQEARELRKMISRITRGSDIKRDNIFCNQIRSAALSVISNIAEGFESRTDKESMNFLNYARRSCGEVRNHLYAALDDDYISGNEFDELHEQACLTGRLVSGFIAYLRRSINAERSKQRHDKTIRQCDHKAIGPKPGGFRARN